MYYLDKILSVSGLPQISAVQIIMLALGFVFIYWAICRRHHPILLLPFAFGMILANVPASNIALSAFDAALLSADNSLLTDLAIALGLETLDINMLKLAFLEADDVVQQAVFGLVDRAGFTNGVLYHFYNFAIVSGAAPILIFLGVGAMTDLSPLISNPRLLLLGIAAQLGIFATLLAAAAFSSYGWIDFSLSQIAAISMIGSADGALVVFSAQTLAPELLAIMSLVAYLSIAMIPFFQPPLMKLLTTRRERLIKMPQARMVGRHEKVLFPLLLLLLTIIFLPLALPLIAAFCLGNLFKESGVTRRLQTLAATTLMDVATLALGLAIGAQLSAQALLNLHTLTMLGLAIMALAMSTVATLLAAKLMNRFNDQALNPLIASAGVSVLPVAAHISQKLAQQEDSSNYLLMPAIAVSVSGFIASALVAGIFYNFF